MDFVFLFLFYKYYFYVEILRLLEEIIFEPEETYIYIAIYTSYL